MTSLLSLKHNLFLDGEMVITFTLYFFFIFYLFLAASSTSRSPSPDVDIDHFLNLPNDTILQYSSENKHIEDLTTSFNKQTAQNHKRKRTPEPVLDIIDKKTSRRESVKHAQRRFVKNLKESNPERLRKINKIKNEKKKNKRLKLDPKAFEEDKRKRK